MKYIIIQILQKRNLKFGGYDGVGECGGGGNEGGEKKRRKSKKWVRIVSICKIPVFLLPMDLDK